ncbi:MAG: right-handed parallel beta-helix repeat-containing protein [Chitinophagaceae bacterium]|nr:right-handed parallel beta-helix repeat-containing protein [Chitinophagaceae bacterium]
MKFTKPYLTLIALAFVCTSQAQIIRGQYWNPIRGLFQWDNGRFKDQLTSPFRLLDNADTGSIGFYKNRFYGKKIIDGSEIWVPFLDSTFGGGGGISGLQFKQTIEERNNIPDESRQEGLLVYVADSLKYYALVGGTGNAYWTEWTAGESGSGVPSPLLTTGNFSFFPINQRTIGDVVSDIIDQYTGEPVTVTKASTYRGQTITDDWVDNVIFFKRGDDYYVRNFSVLQVDWYGASDLATVFVKIMRAAVNGSTVEFGKDKVYTINAQDSIWRIDNRSGFTIIGNNSTIQNLERSYASVWITNSSNISITGLKINLNLLADNGFRFSNVNGVFVNACLVENQYKRGNGLHGGFYFMDAYNVYVNNSIGRNIVNSDTTANSHSPFLKVVNGGNINANNNKVDSVGVGFNLTNVYGGDLIGNKIDSIKDNGYYFLAGTRNVNVSGGYVNASEEGLVYYPGTWDFDAAIKVSNLKFSNSRNRGITLRLGKGLSIDNCVFEGGFAAIAQSASYDGVHDISVTNCTFSNLASTIPIYFNKDTSITFTGNKIYNPAIDSAVGISFLNVQNAIVTDNIIKDSINNRFLYGIRATTSRDLRVSSNDIAGVFENKVQLNTTSRVEVDLDGTMTRDSIAFKSNSAAGIKMDAAAGGIETVLPGVTRFSMRKSNFNRFEFYDENTTANSRMAMWRGYFGATSGRNEMFKMLGSLSAGGSNTFRMIYMGVDRESWGSGEQSFLTMALRAPGDTATNTDTTIHYFRIDGSAYHRDGLVTGSNSVRDSSASIQSNGSNKGWLPNRWSNSQMNAISNPAEGLFGFNNGTGIKTMYQFNGTAWEKFYTPSNLIDLNVNSFSSVTVSGANRDYVHTGGASTWTMLAIAGNTKNYIYIKNRGTGNITLNSNSGGNDFHDSIAVSSIVIPPADAVRLLNDGTYWNVEWMHYSTASGGGGGGGSGTVNSGTSNRLAYYPSNGTTVDDLGAITANRALISDANGLPIHSAITSTQLGYLSGLPGNVQDTINALKARIAALETNVDVDFTFWRDGDSIRLDFSGQEFAVYAPVISGSSSAGTWTPTVGGISNYSSATVRHCSYQRIDNIVSVSGIITVDPTIGTTTQFYFTLPPGNTSNFTTSYDAHGTISVDGAASAQMTGYVWADTSNNRINISFYTADDDTQEVQFSIQYEVK